MVNKVWVVTGEHKVLTFLAIWQLKIKVLWRFDHMWLEISKRYSSYSFFSSAALLCQQNYCRGAGVRRPFINSGLSETAA